jgi:serine/threonine-protein kinase
VPTDVQGKLLDGRYRLLRRLGAGGMGTVFLAEDERLGRKVAVKRLHADSPEETARRFEREARLGAMLNHPNLVAVYDTFSEREDVLIVMEYVEGPTLADVLRRDSLERPRALEILRGVAAALDHAHAQGVVHRDVKPANILLGPEGTAKLADLGIATAAEQTHITRTGTMLGSPSYMAPEQIDGRPVTKAADVYALAAVAFEVLGGRKAQPGGTPLEIAHRIVSEPPPDVREPWPEAPPALAAALKAGMAPDPAERPATCGELVRGLEEAARADATTQPTRPLPPLAAPARRGEPRRGRQAGAGAGPRSGARDGAESPRVAAAGPGAGPAAGARGDGESQPAAAPGPAPERPRDTARSGPRPARGDDPARGEWRAAAATRAAPPPPGPPAEPPRPYVPQRGRRRLTAPAVLAAAAVLFLGGVVAWAALGPLAGGPDRTAEPPRERTAPETTAAEPAPQTTEAEPAPTTTEEAPPPTTTREAPAETTTPEGQPDAARARRLNDQGYALSQAGDDEAAVPVLQRALAAWPEGSEGELEYAFTLFNLGHSLRVTGNPDDAIPLLEKRLELTDNQRGTVERELRLARREAKEED